jgi:hypothetical protein
VKRSLTLHHSVNIILSLQQTRTSHRRTHQPTEQDPANKNNAPQPGYDSSSNESVTGKKMITSETRHRRYARQDFWT